MTTPETVRVAQAISRILQAVQEIEGIIDMHGITLRYNGVPTFKMIIQVVGDEFGKTYEDLVNPGNRHSPPRHVAMYLCRQIRQASLPELGMVFGHRHHTTVLHGIRNVEKRCAEDSEFKARLDGIAAALKGESK